MAEGGVSPGIPSWSSKIQCRYYLHGVCRQGDSCHYAHDKSAKPSNVCRYYLSGRCSYGTACRYDHVKPQVTPTRYIPPSPSFKQTLSPVVSNFGEVRSNMVSLKKKSVNADTPVINSSPKPPEEWVKATEFVPGLPYVCSAIPASYAKAAGGEENESENVEVPLPPEELITGDGHLLCPFMVKGECPFGTECTYLHGDICDLCGLAVLNPNDEKQQEKHKKECIEQHEKDMETSFALARSENKVCGICMDVIMEKMPLSERRFGILSDCNHVYCLSCIRKWRCSQQFENQIIKACPECRTNSRFVTPSNFWVETKEEKTKLITDYKTALSNKPCKYFKQGSGECPFEGKCFYRHAYPDGTLAEKKPMRRRRRQNAEGELDFLRQIQLSEFLEERSNRALPLLLLELEDELDNLLFNLMLSDSNSESDFDSD